jgi:hypothetical protein
VIDQQINFNAVIETLKCSYKITCIGTILVSRGTAGTHFFFNLHSRGTCINKLNSQKLSNKIEENEKDLFTEPYNLLIHHISSQS